MMQFCFRKRRCCFFVMMLFSLIVITVKTFKASFQCTKKESIMILKQLCTDYHKGHVAGNLCPDLCDTQAMQFESCTNYRGGKIVLRMKWKDKFIILKAKKPYINSFDLPSFAGSLNDFIQIVVDSVYFNLPMKRDKVPDIEIFTKLWKDEIDKYTIHGLSDTGESTSWHPGACNSLWSLMQQDEYPLIALYNNYSYFPELYGTCGHFYALNYMPPGRHLASFKFDVLNMWNQPWKERAVIALKLLRLMRNFDEQFPEVLHMCDMKGDNFGISEDGVVGAIDVDMAIFEGRLKSDLLFPNCTTHDNCSFFDCLGWCDVSAGRCSGIRTNNNLQILCEKVLQSHISNAFNGLLHSPPNSVSEISSVLLECAKPPAPKKLLPGCTRAGTSVRCAVTSERKPVRYRAEKRYYTLLRNLIEKSLS